MSFRLELPANILLCGMTKSGKTHLLKCLMGLHADFFNYGVVISSTSFNGEYDYIPDDYVFEDFDASVIDNIIAKQREYVIEQKAGKIRKVPECFIIIDDQLGILELHQKRNMFDVLFAKSRHLHITIFLSIQSCSYLSTTIRSNSSYIFITKLKSSSVKMMYDVSRDFDTEDDFRKYLKKNCKNYRVVMFDDNNMNDDYIRIIRAPETIPEFYLEY